MHKSSRDLQVNFEPPSDFAGESPSGCRGWVKWVGIGCAGIALIMTLIMTFGGFKAFSWCSNLFETGKMTIASEQFAQEFVRSIQNKDYETAYGMTNVEEYQSTTTLDGFTAKFAAHEALLARSVPVVSAITGMTVGSDKDPRWELSIRLLPPDGDEMLTMALKVGGHLTKGADPAAVLEVFDVSIDQRKRDIAAEPPAMVAVEFHKLLGRGEYEEAYRKFGREFPTDETEDASKMNEAAFIMFIKENESILTRKMTEVVRVQYADSDQAEVVMRVGLSDQSSALVTYKMRRLSAYGDWRVWEIIPEPEVSETPEVVDPDSDGDQQDSASEDQVENEVVE